MGEARIEFKELQPRRTPEAGDERTWFEEGHELTTDEAIALARDVAFATG